MNTGELRDPREKVDATTDARIESELWMEWSEFDRGVSCADESVLRRIKSNIDREIGPAVVPTGKFTNRMRPMRRAAMAAAAVLLPIFVASTILLYVEGARTGSDMMTITTGEGEKASVTLPDGTKIALNVKSKLEYSIGAYNGKERRVNFSGEGYFDVARDERVPYVIDSRGLEVSVLGTKFNFANREDLPHAELALEQGSVRLLSTMNGSVATLKPDQKATLYRRTGEIRVTGEEEVERNSAWRHGDLIFRNTELGYILKTLEDNYGLRMDMSDCPIDRNEMFTGTLPSGNLNEVLDILEYSFHVKTRIYGDTVYFTSKF